MVIGVGASGAHRLVVAMVKRIRRQKSGEHANGTAVTWKGDRVGLLEQRAISHRGVGRTDTHSAMLQSRTVSKH